MAAERLQKFLARTGVASRRAAEQLIVNGRVRVDGRIVTELGVRVDARNAKVELDGRRLVAEHYVYVILHKPRGVVSTLSDPEGRETVADLLRGVGVRVVPVGRLDFHTSGALLCTNDGDFASRLLHPRGGVPKEYVAKVRGVLRESDLGKFRESIEIDGRATQPAQVRLDRVEGDKTWIELVLREGRNRQVRRLGDHAGFPVLRLARTAHAGITTHNLRPGQWRHLGQDELAELKRVYGVPKVIHAPFEQHPTSRNPSNARARPAARPGRSSAGGRSGDEPRRANEPRRFNRVPSGSSEPSRFAAGTGHAGRSSQSSRSGGKPRRPNDADRPGPARSSPGPKPSSVSARSRERPSPSRAGAGGERPLDERARAGARPRRKNSKRPM